MGESLKLIAVFLYRSDLFSEAAEPRGSSGFTLDGNLDGNRVQQD